jgi:hypothetical protein
MAIKPSNGDPVVQIWASPVPKRAEGGPISNAVCRVTAFIIVTALQLVAYVIAIWLACTEPRPTARDGDPAGS